MRPEIPRPSRAPGMSRHGIEILAKSIYRELCNRGCLGSDVIRLATALLDQILVRQIEQSDGCHEASPAQRDQAA